MPGGRAAWLLAAAYLMLLAGAADGSSPRWTTGPPYFTNQGQLVIWYTDQPRYFTDPGDLSTSVTHAVADQMVAAAAAVWNVPSARIVLQQGGTLDEQVSGSDVYMGNNGLVYPADMQSANYAAKQIAVVYDRDGSVTDLLLGSGASDPSGCRQNAVTESVDSIVPAGLIQHAVLILNGRCTGPAPEQQLQMQYQLERAFGRVLGVGWSQLNDNLFTGSPVATYAQALHWPIMHPIDIICGLYTYQCFPQPFTLRDDDVASLTFLYPVSSNPGPGKNANDGQPSVLEGEMMFPSQEGVAGMNVVIQRNGLPQQFLDLYEDVSAVSGVFTQQIGGNPITPKGTGVEDSFGVINTQYGVAGYFRFPWIPLINGAASQDLRMHTEAINPLYTGAYAIVPYVSSTVNPAGGSVIWHVSDVPPGWYGFFTMPVPNTPSACDGSGDGTESAPVPPGAGGWWTGVFCGSSAVQMSFAHTAWVNLPVRAGRSLTVEVTALDEQGVSTAAKARPVIGIWNETDPVGSAPTVAAAAVAFNSVAVGMTRQVVQSFLPGTLRIALAEERGDGRPDYSYRARVLYADTMTPATGSGNQQVTITGMGFRSGNRVTVNGVVATVASWTATTIVATVPYLKTVQPGTSLLADVVVTDLSTNGLTTMSGAFLYNYTALPYTLALVSAPSGSVPVGLAASPSFSVRAIDVDGTTPMAGVPVIFTATAGSVAWSSCGAASCTVMTDANGLATEGVTPMAPGGVTLQAAALGLAQTISFTAVPLVRTMTVTPLVVFVAAGVAVHWTANGLAQQQAAPASLVPVTWTATGPLTLAAMQAVTNGQGVATAEVTAGPMAGGIQAGGSVCAWTSMCAGFAAEGVDPSNFVVTAINGMSQSVVAAASLGTLSAGVSDAAGHPVAGAEVQIHQTVTQWTVACPLTGRCPLAPLLESSMTVATTDLNGMVTISPLQIAGAEVTKIVVTSGTGGFLSLTLQKHP